MAANLAFTILAQFAISLSANPMLCCLHQTKQSFHPMLSFELVEDLNERSRIFAGI